MKVFRKQTHIEHISIIQHDFEYKKGVPREKKEVSVIFQGLCCKCFKHATANCEMNKIGFMEPYIVTFTLPFGLSVFDSITANHYNIITFLNHCFVN